MTSTRRRTQIQQDTPQMFDQPSALDWGAPLAARMRPRTLAEVIGQQHLIGPDGPIRRALEADFLPSFILWGPPGCGKTTLARALAQQTHARFATLSAVSSGVGDLRKVITSAEQGLRAGLARTLLFIDEIHRFNKAQQDAVLHAVEDGVVILIGATTENPSFEVIAPLLSRTRVFRLEPLAATEVRALLVRALDDRERGLGQSAARVSGEALDLLADLSGGDARVALNALEAAVRQVGGGGLVDRKIVASAAERPLRYDHDGEAHYDTISAFIKSVRGSDPDAAVYWLARMLEAGEDPMFVARRMVILAAEDVGLADPGALGVAVAAQQAAHFVGLPEAVLVLSEAALYLARAPKSNSSMTAYAAAARAVREHGDLPVPLHLRNAVTGLMASMGYGRGYQYAHDYEGGVAVEQTHLPEQLAGARFYEANERDR